MVAVVTAQLQAVLESAARLQQLVPDSVLVGGSAAALYANHRFSFDHDHILVDLADRFDLVLDALERETDWVTNRVTPGKIILGELGEIEAGVRQLIRRVPLETEIYFIDDEHQITVPTLPEIIRIKAFLITKRNQVRDYLDVAALADTIGIETTALILSKIDAYYADSLKEGPQVASQIIRQLSNPNPKDSQTIRELKNYKGLVEPWTNWESVVDTCRKIADRMVELDAAI